MAEKLTVGQKLWYVPREKRNVWQAREVTVEKIGRKWASISHGRRIDLEDWRVDGGQYSSPGRCYSSKEAWDAERARNMIWRTLRDNIDHTPPEGITTDAIRQAAALLGIQLPSDAQDSTQGETP